MNGKPPRPFLQPGKSSLLDRFQKFTIKEGTSMDILFLLDATVSMRPYRDAVVEHLVDTVRNMMAMFSYASVNIGAVAYRDTKLTPRFEILNFTELADAEGAGMEAVIAWLNALKFHTSTSQDFPEDVHGGLEKAAELMWKSACKTIIHIADAPGHGKRLASPSAPAKYTADDQPDFDSDGEELKKLMLKLREEIKVDEYAFLQIITKDDKSQQKYKLTDEMVIKMKEASGDPAWINEFDWRDDMFRYQVLEAASTSICRSISVTNNRYMLDVRREHKVVAEEPDWDSLETVKVEVSKHHPISSIKNLLDMVEDQKHCMTYIAEAGSLKIAPNPFAMGNARLVYYGRYQTQGEEEWKEVVLKEFICRASDANRALSYKAQMETHTVASFLASQFNKHVSETPVCVGTPEVKFVDCSFITPMYKRKLRFMLMEPRMPGLMVKFNGNNGYVNLQDPQPHLQAFSHWTYEVTEKILIAVDIQGFKIPKTATSEAEILLTDPAIHCKKSTHFNPVSGNTNLSISGPEMFFKSHNHEQFNNDTIKLCGPLCNAMIPFASNFRDRQPKGSRPCTPNRPHSRQRNQSDSRPNTPGRRGPNGGPSTPGAQSPNDRPSPPGAQGPNDRPNPPGAQGPKGRPNTPGAQGHNSRRNFPGPGMPNMPSKSPEHGPLRGRQSSSPEPKASEKQYRPPNRGCSARRRQAD